MATYTPNYNLEKPDATDDFGDFRASYNSNMNIIDQNLGGGGGGGDTVSWTQIQATGEKIAEITINGTTTDVLIPFEAKIIVTTTTGLTVTATKGGTTYTATETSTGVYEVIVDSKGTWTVTDGTNTTTVSVTAQTTYNVAFVVIPDGSTVTPTDDIQTWLNCANIWDKSYTALAEVLADTTTLSALISSNNAVDYMVRSTTWAGISLVPTMSSNTTPSGVCFGESLLSGSNYYGAFDKVINDSSNAYKFVSNGHKPSYVGYRFTQPVNVGRFEITPSARDIPTNFTLQGSNNGSDWIDIQTYVDSTMSGLITKSFDVVNPSSYEYYRLYVLETNESSRPYVQIVELQFYSTSITENATAMSYIGLNNYCANKLLADATWRTAICNSTYFESVLNVKVPTMTSNTTPSGTASGTATQEGDYYKAFDGSGDYWYGQPANPEYVQYDFGRLVRIFKLYMNVRGISTAARTWNVKYQGSDDNVTYSDMTESFDTTSITTSQWYEDTRISNVTTPVRSVRFVVNTNYYTPCIPILQFYGREDV